MACFLGRLDVGRSRRSGIPTEVIVFQGGDRREHVQETRYLGANVENTSSPVAGEYRAYGFDPIGNRTTTTEGAATNGYSTNALNEYTSADSVALSYDADGNLTGNGA